LRRSFGQDSLQHLLPLFSQDVALGACIFGQILAGVEVAIKIDRRPDIVGQKAGPAL
jgi:hypothetical protein